MAPHICMMVDVVYLFEQTNKSLQIKKG